MERSFFRNRSGATAVEFAIVAPVFLALTLGTIVIGLALWYQNIVQDVTAEAARCLAVQDAACTVQGASCSAGDTACYVTALAAARGLPDLTSSAVTIDPDAKIEDASFTRVSITYFFHLMEFQLDLSASSVFPNS